MANAPPAALLRLREADVVRLCGFAAAARGLELADRHTVTSGKRAEVRLEASVADESPCLVTAELPGATGAMRWTCAVHAPSSLDFPTSDLGCAHVAALLTAWIRAPSDFPSTDTPAAHTPAPEPRHLRPQVRQPALIVSSRAPRPRGSSLEDELAALPVAELLAIARRVLGADLAEQDARSRLMRALADRELVPSLLARLGAGPRKLFAFLRLLGGAITATDLDALAVRSDCAPSSIRAEIAVLARHGLVFAAPGIAHAGDATHDHHRDHHRDRSWRELSGWRIPPEVRSAVAPRLPLDPLPAREPHGIPLVERTEETMTSQPRGLRVERASLRPLCLALALLARAPASLGPFAHQRVAREHMPSSRQTTTSSAFARMLAPNDLAPGRLAALPRAAGLDPTAATLARRILLIAHDSVPGQPLTDLARAPSAERIVALRAGFRLWRDAELAIELAELEASDAPIRVRYDTAHSAFRPADIGGEVARARRFVLRLLAAAAPGAWYALDDFVALVWQLDPLFLRGRQQTYERPAWWLERASDTAGPDGAHRPLRPGVREEWTAGEGVYLRRLLTGPLKGWGALDLAYDSAGQPVAFRITPFGRMALSAGEAAPQVEVQAEIEAELMDMLAGEWGPAVLPTRDGDLAAQPLAAGAELLDTLDRWAHPTALAGGRLIYRLSPDLACAAFDHGASPEELPQRLRAADPGGGGRPAELVAKKLGAWRAAYGATRIQEEWALLEARDEPSLIEALALVPGLAARCRRLDATHALVPAQDVATLDALLARRGFSG